MSGEFGNSNLEGRSLFASEDLGTLEKKSGRMGFRRRRGLAASATLQRRRNEVGGFNPCNAINAATGKETDRRENIRPTGMRSPR